MSSDTEKIEDVKRLAQLARLSVPEEDLERFATEFDAILGYIGKLDELTLPDMNEMPLPAVRNVFREDGEPEETGAWTQKLVEQFPQKEGDYLSVKQIISHD